MNASEVQWLASQLLAWMQPLIHTVTLSESITLIGVAATLFGALPLVLREAREQLMLVLRSYASTCSLRTFIWIPIGLALIYVA